MIVNFITNYDKEVISSVVLNEGTPCIPRIGESIDVLLKDEVITFIVIDIRHKISTYGKNWLNSSYSEINIYLDFYKER